MENIFNTENAARTPSAKQTTIKIDKDLLDKLKNLNKGSPNKAIEWLLSRDNPDNLKERIKTINEDIFKLQEQLERIVSINRLRY